MALLDYYMFMYVMCCQACHLTRCLQTHLIGIDLNESIHQTAIQELPRPHKMHGCFDFYNFEVSIPEGLERKWDINLACRQLVIGFSFVGIQKWKSHFGNKYCKTAMILAMYHQTMLLTCFQT